MARRIMMTKPTAFALALCVLIFLIAVPGGFAQFSSGFTGIIVDQTGAVVVGAKITVTNEATQVSNAAISNDSGNFRVPSLAGGLYTIEVSAPGFKSWTETGIKLENNETKTVRPSLALPNQAVTVQVSAGVAAVETDKSDTSREISQQTIETAPLIGRNVYTSMIQLAPGITGSGLPSGGALGSGSANNDSFEQEAGYQINAAGQRQEDNEYDVDGSILNSASRDGVVNLSPEPDFINTIRVSGATFDAAKGRYSGAWVQVFTKPGTNDFHGTASEYFTNNNLTARTEFQYCAPDAAGCEAIPAFRRNEFGGTFGGPIIKNKLFFFVGAFGLLSSNASTILTDVETKDFAQYVQQNFPNSLANTFFSEAPPSVYPSASILTAAQVQQQNPGFYPATSFPADLPVAGLIDVPLSLTHNAYQWHIRNDYNPSDKDRIFFSFFRTYSDQLQADARPIYRVVIPNTGLYAKVDWTRAFSSRLINEASMTLVRAVGSNPSALNHKELPNVNISGVSGFNQWGSAGWVHENFNWHDVLSWTHGKHTISTGFDIDRHHDDDKFTSALLRPSFGFGNLMDFAQDGVHDQTGPAMKTASSSLASDLYQILRWVYGGVYVQDDWKITPRLTLNAGLRWDYFGHWGTYYNSQTPFPFFKPGSGGDFATQIATGAMTIHGGRSAYVTVNKPSGFDPRFGFGWDVFGNGKMAVRGGYGWYYNNVADGSWSFPSRANPPTWANPSFSLTSSSHPFTYSLGSTDGLTWPIPPGITFETTPSGGIVGLPVLTSGVQPHMDQPHTQVWMLAIQKDLGHDLIVEADYNGSDSRNLYLQTDVNRFPGDLIQHGGNQTRLQPEFGPIIFGRGIGIADGHYGSLMLTKRLRHSWSIRGIYTFGKSTDEMSSNDNGTANGEAIFNPLDPMSQHGLSDFNVAKRFTIDSLVMMPDIFKSGWSKWILGGWRMSDIVVLQGGLPFTVFTSASFNPILDAGGNVIGLNPGSGDFNADGYGYDVPDKPASGVVKTSERSDFLNGFAKSSDFPTPALGSQGNGGRNTYSGPGMASVNAQFTKEFKIERFGVEFRADLFNLFNRVNLTSPDSDLSSGTFGYSTSQNIPRSAQFGLHFSF
jgi:Carboxypeptidase regulatory-like domain/TonB dependent receptor-like, beta-barrel